MFLVRRRASGGTGTEMRTGPCVDEVPERRSAAGRSSRVPDAEFDIRREPVY